MVSVEASEACMCVYAELSRERGNCQQTVQQKLRKAACSACGRLPAVGAGLAAADIGAGCGSGLWATLLKSCTNVRAQRAVQSIACLK